MIIFNHQQLEVNMSPASFANRIKQVRELLRNDKHVINSGEDFIIETPKFHNCLTGLEVNSGTMKAYIYDYSTPMKEHYNFLLTLCAENRNGDMSDFLSKHRIRRAVHNMSMSDVEDILIQQKSLMCKMLIAAHDLQKIIQLEMYLKK
jgi:hypothetical protein